MQAGEGLFALLACLGKGMLGGCWIGLMACKHSRLSNPTCEDGV